MLNIRRCSVTDIIHHPHFPALREEYAAECAIYGLPDPAEKLELYLAMQNSGALSTFGAFVEQGEGAELVGFVVVLAPVLPHYGVVVAVTESLFVAHAHRKSGAGLALMRRAENHAQGLDSKGLLVSAPSGGRLHRLLPRLGYRETNVTFFKEFPHV